MNGAYRVALFCAAFPLLVGISIFVLWLTTRWDWLMVAGWFTICGGLVFFFVGLASLGCYCGLALRKADESRRHIWLSSIACAGLLLSNIPIAAGITTAAVAILTRYTVVIHNDARQAMDDVRVFGGGCEAAFGTIPPGATAQRSFWIRQDGTLEFEAASGATTYAKTIDGYVTNGMGRRTEVTINPDGTIAVSHNNH